MQYQKKLLSVSGEPLSNRAVALNIPDLDEQGSLVRELLALLGRKNGFYGFESALHVFPAAVFEQEMTLGRWNSFGLWRHEYSSIADNKLFFAENAFGDQFCLFKGEVCSFDAETGETTKIGNTIEEWAQRMIEDYELLTGYPLLHEWQLVHGPVPIGMRLMPKTPFVLGGQFALGNVYAISAISGMKTRGNLARQIKELPDGTQITFRVIE
jgi:hypothetical protein